MAVGVTMRSALAASAIAAAKRGKKRRRRTLLTRCGGRNGVGGASAESRCAAAGCCDGGARDWSALPDPAVLLVLTALLPSLKDAFSLGSVCRAWRSVFAACKRDIFLALPPLLVDRSSSPRALGGFYSLRERRFHRRKPNSDFWPWKYRRGRPVWPTMDVIGVSHGYWIVCAASRLRNGPTPIFVMDPLSPEVRINLPPTPHTPYAYMSAVMAAPPSSPDCVVVLSEVDCILYCRPGDTQWMRHSFVEGRGGDDRDSLICTMYLEPHQVAIAGGKLYALNGHGKVVIVELFPRPTVTILETSPLWSCRCLPHMRSGFLMESNGEILHIAHLGEPDLEQLLGPCRVDHKFVVRRLDVPAQQWVTLSTLGDRCLFLKSEAACVTGFAPARWGGERDCLYVCCPYFRVHVFHMKHGRIEQHRMPTDYISFDWLIPSFCY